MTSTGPSPQADAVAVAHADPSALAAAVRPLLAFDSDGRVDLDSVARRLDVVMIEGRGGLAFSGALERSGDGFRIVYALEQDDAHKRFTIAHELAHAYLILSSSVHAPGEEIERFCDRFARELLIPMDSLQLFWRDAGALTADELRRCADVFAAPLRTVAARWAELRPVAIAYSDVHAVIWAAGDISPIEDFLGRAIRSVVYSGVGLCDRVNLDGNQAWVEVSPFDDRDVLVISHPRPTTDDVVSCLWHDQTDRAALDISTVGL